MLSNHQTPVPKVQANSALTSGTKRVSGRKLPHPGQELAEPANAESHAHNGIRLGNDVS
jgi:hypothetical protein